MSILTERLEMRAENRHSDWKGGSHWDLGTTELLVVRSGHGGVWWIRTGERERTQASPIFFFFSLVLMGSDDIGWQLETHVEPREDFFKDGML